MSKSNDPLSLNSGGFSSFKNKCRSKFEQRIGRELSEKGIPIVYEQIKLKFTQPAQQRTYTPDFILPNNIIIEAKGRLTSKNRKKHEWVREGHPKLDIRFVFQRANNPIYKGSKTTYAMWAEKNNFMWSEGYIPDEWIAEPKKELDLTTKNIKVKRG